MSALPAPLALRLVKVLNLTSSPVNGEVLAAARMANSLLRQAGLTWDRIVREPLSTEHGLSDNEAIEISLAHPQALTAWEREFAQSLHRGGFTSRLSQKQKTVLHRLARKCAAGGSDA